MPLSPLQLDLQPEAKVLMSVQYFLEDGGKTSMVAGATPVARSGAELALMSTRLKIMNLNVTLCIFTLLSHC